MCDLDSELRGEKAAGYCSSSDDEEEKLHVEAANEDNLNSGLPINPNTGPKGVLHDYKLYKKTRTVGE